MTKKICSTLRTLNDGNYGICLFMGNAGFISSTVASGLGLQLEGSDEGSVALAFAGLGFRV